MHQYLIDLIELLYTYKNSILFDIHLAMVILVGVAFVAVSINLYDETKA